MKEGMGGLVPRLLNAHYAAPSFHNCAFALKPNGARSGPCWLVIMSIRSCHEWALVLYCIAVLVLHSKSGARLNWLN
jgi:hypothetical protein